MMRLLSVSKAANKRTVPFFAYGRSNHGPTGDRLCRERSVVPPVCPGKQPLSQPIWTPRKRPGAYDRLEVDEDGAERVHDPYRIEYLRRVRKDSFFWYRDVIAMNGEDPAYAPDKLAKLFWQLHERHDAVEITY